MSIITLNVKGLNAPTKRHRLAEWIQKQDPYMCCLQETHFRPKDIYRLKVRIQAGLCIDMGEGNGTPLLENPKDGGAWQAAVHGVLRVGHH